MAKKTRQSRYGKSAHATRKAKSDLQDYKELHKPRNHIKAWRTRNRLINYKVIADNGKSLFPSGNQQFETMAGFRKSLIAIGKFFNSRGVDLKIKWTASPRAKTVLKEEVFTIKG